MEPTRLHSIIHGLTVKSAETQESGLGMEGGGHECPARQLRFSERWQCLDPQVGGGTNRVVLTLTNCKKS